MNKMSVTLLVPEDAACSVPLLVEKRCNNCMLYDSCKKINDEENAVKFLYNKMIKTDCNHFIPQFVVVVDDKDEIARLEAFALQTS